MGDQEFVFDPDAFPIIVQPNDDGTFYGESSYSVLAGHHEFMTLVRTLSAFADIVVTVYNPEHLLQTGDLGPEEQITLCQISRPRTRCYISPETLNRMTRTRARTVRRRTD